MYRQFIIKNLKDNKETLGESSLWINTVLVTVEVKRSFIEKLVKKAETVFFTVLSDSGMHYSAKRAYETNSAWEVDMDVFTLNEIVGRKIYVANEINKQKSILEEKKRKEKEANNIKEAVKENEPKTQPQLQPKLQPKQQTQFKEENQTMPLHRYFNAVQDLMVFKFKNSEMSLRPYDMDYIQNDISILKTMLSFDPEIKKYFPKFWGPNAEDNIQTYLINTCMTTEAGIAFAYALRLNAGILGIIKVTSPEHNRVTNNFPYWMIDYLMIPAMRNRGLMKASLPIILKFLHEKLGINEIYAMVETDNTASIHLLELNGFIEDKSKQIATNPEEHKKAIAMRKVF